MNYRHVRIFILLLTAYALCACCNSPNILQAESLYSRVIRSGEIRCGYLNYPPYCTKDPNTGKFSGIFVEIMEEAGKNLGLKIIWQEEVGGATMIEGLETNRYDLVPTGVWQNTNRGKHASFSLPLFYTGIGVYVRSNDNRFTNKLVNINEPSVTIATIDGQAAQIVARNKFPRANILTHPDMSHTSQLLLDVTSKKADVTLVEPGFAAIFQKNNQNTVKNITERKPITIYPNTMMFKIGEPAFKSMLDSALSELINTGYIDAVIKKYEPAPGVYFRVALPYRTN
jgi:ABC-type amino acid transport substrate-binding protein